MKRNITVALLCYIFVGSLGNAAVLLKFQDDTGHWVILKHPAKRIISLAPNLTEMLYAIGGGPQVVAVGRDSDYPRAVDSLPKLSSYPRLDIERILSFKPDLVLVWLVGSQVGGLQQLSQLGVPVYYAHITHLSDIASTMAQLGKLTGHAKQANLQAAQFMKQYHQLQKKEANRPVISVMLQESNQPIYVATGDSLQTQMMRLCGGHNVFKRLSGQARPVSLESVLAKNPMVILSVSPINAQQFWSAWPQLSAVKNHRLYTLPADLVARPGPRILAGVHLICQRLHQLNI